jgi:hypothetical protein
MWEFFPDQAAIELVGVDTKAAEQTFHIASRWQSNLSNSHAVHFDLQLLLFANDHNERNRCDVAFQEYTVMQASRSETAPTLQEVPAPPAAASEPCSQRPARKKGKKKLISMGCDENCDHQQHLHDLPQMGAPASASTSQAPVDVALADVVPADTMLQGVGRDFLGCKEVYVNWSSSTVHKVMFRVRGCVEVKCSYIPPYAAKVTQLAALAGVALYTCGTCCGARHLLLLDD